MMRRPASAGTSVLRSGDRADGCMWRGSTCGRDRGPRLPGLGSLRMKELFQLETRVAGREDRHVVGRVKHDIAPWHQERPGALDRHEHRVRWPRDAGYGGTDERRAGLD